MEVQTMQNEQFNNATQFGWLRGTVYLALAGLLCAMPAVAQQHRYIVLHSFDGYDGDAHYGGLIADSAGNLYGTTFAGESGFGGVFKLDLAGTLTILYSFTGGTDGGSPHAG